MRVIRGLSNLAHFLDGCVATIGNFDGVHLGHQMVISHLANQGKKLGLPSVVLLFEPQPLEYFRGVANAPSRLTRFREKVRHLRQLPVDYILLIRFSREFAELSANQFVADILLDALKVKYLVVGDDFRFGKGRLGDFSMLKKISQSAGFELEAMPSFIRDGQRVSSTIIRTALADGDLETAAQLLGRPYSVCGRVIHGHKRGRTVGFPTANISLFRKNSPVTGVFAVTMEGLDRQQLMGVANVGTRPTVDGDASLLLETHLFDFDEEIYGRIVEVKFQAKIREERRFDSFEALSKQIALDAEMARAYLLEQLSTEQVIDQI